MNFGSMVTSFTTVASDLIQSVSEGFHNIISIFNGVDFGILWFWLPSDIQNILNAIVIILICLCILGVLKKLIFFLT